MRIAIDVKNLALFGGGIANFCKPLIRAWMIKDACNEFVLIGPEFDSNFIRDLKNWSWKKTRFLKNANILFRHPVYDYFFSNIAIRQVKPDLFFSPYFDIFIPRRTKSIVTIHDSCFTDASSVYPWHLKYYYLTALKRNANNAHKILTVSQASKKRLIELYGIDSERIFVIYNAFNERFLQTKKDPNVQHELRKKYAIENHKLILYPGGLELRKNIDNLIFSIKILQNKLNCRVKLFITGKHDNRSIDRWSALRSESFFSDIVYTGHLSVEQLKQFYYFTDAVVYPSLCEGFGRICLDAMAAGVPFVCSDIEVMHEVGGDFPIYCNPHDPSDIADKIMVALNARPKSEYLPVKYDIQNIVGSFLSAVEEKSV